MKKLEQANDLPMFIATSEMVAKVPVLNSVNSDEINIGDVMNNVKTIEESMNAFMEDQKTQMKALMDNVRRPAPATVQGARGNNHVSRFLNREQQQEPQPGNKRRRSINDQGESVVVHTDGIHVEEEDVFVEKLCSRPSREQ